MAEKEDEIHSTAEDSPLLVDSSDLDEKETFRLAKYERYAYGLGHICNDVCAAMWFSYALIFYQIVIGFPPVYAGYLLFIGKQFIRSLSYIYELIHGVRENLVASRVWIIVN